MNKVTLSGYLGRDTEVTYLPDGTMKATASLATSNDYQDKKGEWVKKNASWHNLVAFGKVAEELAEYGKGDKLRVEGKIEYRSWEKDGIKRYGTDIRIFRVGAEEKKEAPPPGDDNVPF